MINSVKIKKDIRTNLLIIVACMLFIALSAFVGLNHVYAEESERPENPVTIKNEECDIPIQTYVLDDNTGYYETADRKVPKLDHPLGKNLINLSVYTESDVAQAKIEKGIVNNYSGYGITGNCVQIKLSYNFDNANELKKGRLSNNHDYVYSISDDTYQSIGKFDKIGVIGTGAMLFQKKTDFDGKWEWQNKDGETKKQLHTFDFTDTVKLSEYSGQEHYVLYTPSGADLSKGVYIKITFAYEIKYTETWKEDFLWWQNDKSSTKYYNIVETAEFYVVQNSGVVLFHNATNYDKIGEDDATGAISIDKFETILDGDVTLNGFRLDTLGIEAYDISYKRNFGSSQRAYDGQFFLGQGRYDFTIKRKIGEEIKHTVFVDRREINDAVVDYFGQSLFTADSQRIYSTGEFPTYIAGAEINLNATDGTVAPVVGKLFIRDSDGEWKECVKEEDGVEKSVLTREIVDYKTDGLKIPVNEVGIYKAEFWGNPKYITEDGVQSGDLYHFVFRFEIVDKDAPREPSVNEAYLDGLIAFSDLQSKYYSVSLQTKGIGKAIYAFSDYGGAYDFAYKMERAKVKIIDDGYEYNEVKYADQKNVLKAIDTVADSRVVIRYFDATDPTSYQTADISDEDITKLNFAQDVIVFANDDEQSYMQAGLPSLNGRKFRYIMPETNDAEDGVLNFAFVHVAGFESETVTLTRKKNGEKTNEVYDIRYDVSVEYQLGLLNAPSGVYTVTERNSFGYFSEYDAVYIKPGEMTGAANISLFRNGELEPIKKDKNNINTVSNLNGFILSSLENELDSYSIVKITHNGKTDIYTFNEVSDMYFADGGVYDFVLIDRQGNTLSFTLIITDPVGFADVHLELEQPDDVIIKDYHVFVGQEIELPTPTLTDELYVFDGWLYDDALISDGKFRPNVKGDSYVWQQITQKYTYLNFDSNGGVPVERIKAEIGIPMGLPTTTKDGWEFGGWSYGGRTYGESYSPTTTSPTFVAVWNYIEPKIELYDGNLYQTITANVGDKILLPFPTRTGYTFFGWREELSDGTNKVYYGQITKLGNVKSLKLDALWIRNSDIVASDLESGRGGNIAVHFIDGALLENDSLQSMAGANISLPKPTRAGYLFVGWVWRTNAISGKIYSGNDMTVPDTGSDKLVLEALWIARTTSGTSGTVTGSISGSENGKGLFYGSSNGNKASKLNIVCLIFSATVFCFVYIRRVTKKKELIDYSILEKRKSVFVNKISGEHNNRPLAVADKVIANSNKPSCNVVTKRNAKRAKVVHCIKYGVATVCTAALLVCVLSITSAFGDYANFNVLQSITNDDKPIVSMSQVIQETHPIENKYIKDINSVDDYQQELDDADLTDDEAFLFSLIMMDIYSLDYNIFSAVAVLEDGSRIDGLGYSDYEELYVDQNIENGGEYIGAGFIAFPHQKQITSNDIKNGVKIFDLNDEFDDSNERCVYYLTVSENYGPCHYVVDNKYVIYSVENTNVTYSINSVDYEQFNPEYGPIYSYDEDRIIFDPDVGNKDKLITTSLNTLLDPVIAKNQYNRYIAEQNANGFTVDTVNFVYISYEALDAYYLSNQDESLLGIDVQEFYDMERTVGPNEYYAVDADGNLIKLDFPPQEEDKASWLDRLAGAVIGLSFIVVGVVISCVATVVTCGAFTAAAPYITGALIGAGMEVFMQTVIQGSKVKDINWMRVGVAAVSGALAAIPGIGWFGAGMLQGATEAAMTAVDGGSLSDVLKSFTVGFVTGVVIHGAGKAVRALRHCFIAGTPILLASGAAVAIENIHVGDYVKSYNEITGKIENKRVLQTFENETNELVTVTTIDGQSIVSTPGHKYFANNKWISAEDLRAGDILVDVNGQQVVVEKIQHELLDCR